jgi:adenylate cyclase class IV
MDVVRIRDEGDGIFLTCKQRFDGDTALDYALESECQVTDFDVVREMFQRLGLTLSVTAEKYRTVWEMDDCEIMYDENPWIDPYFEIE